jgi:hypothetical protein
MVTFFGLPDDKKAPSAFQGVIQALRAHVEPRILADLLKSIDRGDPVKIGSLTFSRKGLYRKSF